VARRVAKLYPGAYLSRFNVLVLSLTEGFIGDVRPLLLILMAGSMMLLLIASSNVASLLLARATAREKEMAVRVAIGAGYGRLTTQLLVESFLFASLACLLGCAFAAAAVRAGSTLVPKGVFPFEADITVNRASLLFALAAGVLTSVVCGVTPAIHAVRRDLYPALAGSGKGSVGDSRHGRLRACLVIGEVALSIVLLAGAGLMMRALLAIEHVKLGFDPTHVLFVNSQRLGLFPSPAAKTVFLRDAVDRIKTLPGVVSAATALTVPPHGTGLTAVVVPGRPESEDLDCISELVSEDYFQTLRIPVVRGRTFARDEVESARHVVVINQSFARVFFDAEDPVGRVIRLPSWEALYSDWPPNTYLQIVGVVGDVKNQGLKGPTRPQVYLPYTMTATGLYDDRLVMVKTASDPAAVFSSVQRVILGAGGTVAIRRMTTLESTLADYSYAQPRLSFLLFAAFAAAGLILVASGVGGVMAYAVSLRTREIGIRMTLGAQRDDIRRMVLGKCVVLLAAGAVIGVAGSLALNRLIASQIWGVSGTDVPSFVAASLAVLLVGLGAGWLPARKASRMDPLEAAHYE